VVDAKGRPYFLWNEDITLAAFPVAFGIAWP
jgi:hypothetical protein